MDNPRPGKYPSSPGAASTGQSVIRPYAGCDKPTRDVLPGKDLQARQVTLAGSPMRRPRSSHRSSLFFFLGLPWLQVSSCGRPQESRRSDRRRGTGGNEGWESRLLDRRDNGNGKLGVVQQAAGFPPTFYL